MANAPVFIAEQLVTDSNASPNITWYNGTPDFILRLPKTGTTPTVVPTVPPNLVFTPGPKATPPSFVPPGQVKLGIVEARPARVPVDGNNGNNGNNANNNSNRDQVRNVMGNYRYAKAVSALEMSNFQKQTESDAADVEVGELTDVNCDPKLDENCRVK